MKNVGRVLQVAPAVHVIDRVLTLVADRSFLRDPELLRQMGSGGLVWREVL
jgi:hypothetical protein